MSTELPPRNFRETKLCTRHIKAGTHRIPGGHTVSAVPSRVSAEQDRRAEGRWAAAGRLGKLDDGEEWEVAWEGHGMHEQQIRIPSALGKSGSQFPCVQNELA